VPTRWQPQWRMQSGHSHYCVRFASPCMQIWCMVRPTQANEDITGAKTWVTFALTWIYMLSQQVWVVFLVVLYCSRLGGMKLGHPEDEPEFPAASWFMMMFSAGIGIGLFFFGVAEPILHYEPCGTTGDFAGPGSTCFGNRYSQLPADDRAQWAMNITFFHWGIHAWVVYCIVGLLLGAVVYRKCAASHNPAVMCNPAAATPALNAWRACHAFMHATGVRHPGTLQRCTVTMP
jgi:choline-glycine betaine transporter